LANPSYVPRLIALGANTDPYQPIERRLVIPSLTDHDMEKILLPSIIL